MAFLQIPKLPEYLLELFQRVLQTVAVSGRSLFPLDRITCILRYIHPAR